MELPQPMEDARRLTDAQRLLQEQQEAADGEATATGFLQVVAVGALCAVIGLMATAGPEWKALFWRIPLGAALLWIPCTLCTMLFSGGTVPFKKALWMGVWPSIVALLPLFAVVLLMLLVLIVGYPIKWIIGIYHWLRPH